jgi:GNAT superfamily N-acetyltransferase
MPGVIEFRDSRVDSGDGASLESAMRAEVERRYPGLDLRAQGMPKAGPDELNPPHGRFIVGYEDGVAVCCGGIKRLDALTCEFKRMYVAPPARGRGLGRLLLEELERRARGLGYRKARLDTDHRQAAAVRLYESAGYLPITNYNANPAATYFGEKRL